MRIGLFAASAAVSLVALAAPGIASASCATAFAAANALRGPQYGNANGTAGCGDYISQSTSPGGNVSATHLDPTGYTHQQASAQIGGGTTESPTGSEAYSRANLADASLHGSASSFGDAFSFSNSSFSETLFFTNTTDQNQYLTIGWLVEGDVEWAAGQGASVVSNFTIGTRHQQGIQEGNLGYYHTNGATYDINGAYNAFGWWPEYPGQGGLFGAAYKSYDLGGQSRLMTSVFGIAPGSAIVDITAFMNIYSSMGATLNYGATGALLFGELADGVSFTSESGVFRPNKLVIPGAGAVPEPSTWALMIGGFGLAGATLRRRRAAIV